MRVGVKDLAPHDPVQQDMVGGVHDAGQEDALMKVRRDVVLLHHPAKQRMRARARHGQECCRGCTPERLFFCAGVVRDELS